MPSEGDSTWNLRYRGDEEFRARQQFEHVNFGTTSFQARGTPNASGNATNTAPPPPPAPSAPLPGVFTLPSSGSFLPPSETGRAWGRRRGRPRKADVDVMPAGTSAVGKHSTDRSFEISVDGARQTVTAESREVVHPENRPARRRRTDNVQTTTPTEDSTTVATDLGYDVQRGDASDEEWDYIEDGASPEDSLDPNGDPVESEDEVDGEARPGKRKAYASSDDPIAIFISLADTVLEETFYLEALPPNSCCRTCGEHENLNVNSHAPNTVIPPTSVPAPSTDETTSVPAPAPTDENLPAHAGNIAPPSPDPLYRCTTCGVFVECRTCCLERHALAPLHTILEWDYTKCFWRNTTLRALGLSYQLGHDGYPCILPTTLKTVTVLHVNGIHRVSAAFCGCSLSVSANHWQQAMRTSWYPASFSSPQTFTTFKCLKYFRTMNVIANANVRDFVTVLERLTDPLGVEWVPDRYKNFGVSTTQWNYMSRMRRSGLGHLPGGVGAAANGAAAVKCWACPRPGINLPPYAIQITS